MPVSTYEKITDRLNRGDPNPTVKVISEKSNIKRSVQLLDEAKTPYFESNNVDTNTRLKVVCAAGDQTKRFQENIKDLEFLERFRAETVL